MTILEESKKEIKKIEWINWKDKTTEFWNFNEKHTQQWINEGFDKEQAREWLKVNVFLSPYARFLVNEKLLLPDQYKQLKEELKESLEKESFVWLENFFPCDFCFRRTSKSELHQDDSIKERPVFLCSVSCQQQWKNYPQLWLDYWYPRHELCFRENEISQYKIEVNNYGKIRNEITKLVFFNQSLLGSLDLSDFVNLEDFSCHGNQLTSLNLTNCLKLKKLNISYNLLSDIDLSNNIDLDDLECWGNLIARLDLRKNTKLRRLHVIKSKMVSGLEYWPLSLQEVYCDGKIGEKLVLYGNNLLLWKIIHANLVKELDQEVPVIDYSLSQIVKVATSPSFLQENLDNEEINLKNSFNSSNYSSFILRDPRSFSWEIDVSSENNSLKIDLNKILPTRLYQISTNKVIETTHNQNLNYAILSYVWGDLSDKANLTTWDYTQQDKDGKITAKQIGVNEQFGATGTTRESIQALKKAIATLNFINKDLASANKIDYLWMDQICINQFDNLEQGQEVTKMRQYYSQASATLIAIDSEIGEIDKSDEFALVKRIMKKAFSSPWFTRSWTFQEGILSKQTIFMFDDALVDGRLLALAWGGLQEKSNGFLLGSKFSIYITPFGWSYGDQFEKKFNLTLGEALLSVKNRNQAVLVDKIYSILGLLPYGNKVKVNYKPWGEKYTQEDLENSLVEVITTATQEGYGRETLLSWACSYGTITYQELIGEGRI